MYDLLRLAPGGGWATDTTGTHAHVLARYHWLQATTRGRRPIRIHDRRTGQEIEIR